MICIRKITDEDFGLESIPFVNPRCRLGARGIVFNNENKIAILHKNLKNEYKLIGGGIDENEDPTKAFKRECLEEAGCKIEIDDCLGTVEELKTLDDFKQTSYIYIAHVLEDIGHTDFTEQEKGEGSELLWLNIDDAMNVIKGSEDKLIASKFDSDKSVYHTKFIVRRDYEILKYYKNHS